MENPWASNNAQGLTGPSLKFFQKKSGLLNIFYSNLIMTQNTISLLHYFAFTYSSMR